MGSFSKMQKQLQADDMRKQLEMMKEQMKQLSFTGSSGNGLVEVTLDGQRLLKKISIKPECVDPSDVEGLQDLIKAAFEEAFSKADQESSF